jgi:hypothetical protein
MSSFHFPFVLVIVLAAGDAGLGARQSPDAGEARVRDAGVAADAGPDSFWQYDGGVIGDAGVTDSLRVRVGETVAVRFGLPIAFGQCDAPLVSVSGKGDAVLFLGLRAGHTRCGYWFQKSALPQRLFAIEVLPSENVSPPKEQRPWWSP